MILGIILAIAGIICCLIAFIISVANSDIIGAIIMLLLVCVNAVLLKFNLDMMYNEPQDMHNKPQEVQTTVVKDIQGFSVDSTLTISGADTTKTYTLTYWK